MTYPLYKQLDAKDCGPSCLRMIARFYGKHFSQDFLREKCFSGKTGSSLLCVKDCANEIGFDTTGVRTLWEKLKSYSSQLPCIALWNKNHFVVIYEITENKVIVGDPAHGILKYSHESFLNCWLSSDRQDGRQEGIVLLMKPNEKFKTVTDMPEQKKISFTFLLKYLKPHIPFLARLTLAMLLGGVLSLIFPFLMQSIVDIGISNRSINFVIAILIAQMVFIISIAVNNLISSWIMVHITSRVSLSLLEDFLGKLMRLPISFFDKKLTGDILQRIGDFTRVEAFLTRTLISIVIAVFTIIIYGTILVRYDARLMIIFALGSIVYISWIFVFLKKRKRLDYMYFQESANSQSNIIQMINGMQEIKLNNCETFKRKEWESIQVKLFNINIKSLNWSQVQEIGGLLIDQVKNLLISFFAATAVIEGNMTLGIMVAIQYIIGQLNVPIIQMVSFIQSVQDTGISIERMNDIYCKKDEVQEDQGKIGTLPSRGEIFIDNLSFHYNGIRSPKVLDEIRLSIPANQVTAIVGTSGSGKTTLLKLILGFYKPNSGNIYLGKNSIYDYSQRIIRAECGVVMQEGFIFSDTIAKNIAVIDEKPDMERVRYACKMACLDEFVLSLPLGYETVIGAEGNSLSTGQKQRILIARAVYKDPPYLFLDEATNALDANNERAIMNNLDEFYKNKTVIVVAHRLSTVKKANNIVVLEKGRIVEFGKHDELIERKGYYFNLVKNQLELGE